MQIRNHLSDLGSNFIAPKNDNFNVSIYSNYLTGDVLEKSDKINLKFLDNKNSFTEDDLSEIYNLSLKTYVDESDKSRERTAGAGLTDND